MIFDKRNDFERIYLKNKSLVTKRRKKYLDTGNGKIHVNFFCSLTNGNDFKRIYYKNKSLAPNGEKTRENEKFGNCFNVELLFSSDTV